MTDKSKNTPAKKTDVVDSVLAKVNNFNKAGELKLPKNYSPENALKSAWLMLQEAVDRSNKPVLESCTQASIATALLDMVVQGLSPMKKQCYFIPYGGKLQLSRSYHGNVAIAKRDGKVKDVWGQAIYEGDEFEFQVDADTGLKKITKHIQTLESINPEKVKGAYAILTLADGTKFIEIMNIQQIRKAWLQGASKGNSPAHKNFGDEMAKKTVINRACKGFINTSDDGGLYEDYDNETDTEETPIKQEIKDNANKKSISIEDTDFQEVKEEKTVEEPAQSSSESSEVIEPDPGF